MISGFICQISQGIFSDIHQYLKFFMKFRLLEELDEINVNARVLRSSYTEILSDAFPVHSGLKQGNVLSSEFKRIRNSWKWMALHPYKKTTGKMIGLYIPIFTFLDSREEDKRLRTEW
jgi:hypothetical protein